MQNRYHTYYQISYVEYKISNELYEIFELVNKISYILYKISNFLYKTYDIYLF